MGQLIGAADGTRGTPGHVSATVQHSSDDPIPISKHTGPSARVHDAASWGEGGDSLVGKRRAWEPEPPDVRRTLRRICSTERSLSGTCDKLDESRRENKTRFTENVWRTCDQLKICPIELSRPGARTPLHRGPPMAKDGLAPNRTLGEWGVEQKGES